MGISTYAQNIIDEKDALIRELMGALSEMVGAMSSPMGTVYALERALPTAIAALARAKQEMGDAD